MLLGIGGSETFLQWGATRQYRGSRSPGHSRKQYKAAAEGFGSGFTGSWLIVLSNDHSCLNEGVARVVIERAASNIFELLIANIFRLDLFAHIRIWLVVMVGLAVLMI